MQHSSKTSRKSHKIVVETSRITAATSKENHCNMQTTRSPPPWGSSLGIHGRGRCRSSMPARLISSHGRAAASYKSRPGKACPPAAQLVLALTAAKRRSSSRRPLPRPGADLQQPPAPGVAQTGGGSGHAIRHRHRRKQQGIGHAEEQEGAHTGGRKLAPPRSSAVAR